jgi:hypothetical protein
MKESKIVQALWYMLVVPALERQRQRQEGHEFEDSLACMM